MAKTRQDKERMLQELNENLKTKRGVYFVNFEGLGGADLFKMRKEIKSSEGLFCVVKKTLLKMALEEQSIEVEDSFLDGQVALTFVSEDEVGPAKAVYEQEEAEIKGGILDGEMISKEQLTVLAQLPSREELQSQLVGSLMSPLSGLRNSLESSLKGLLLVLSG